MAKTQTQTLAKKDLNASFLEIKDEIYDMLPFIFQKDSFFPFMDFLAKWQHYSIYNVILLYKQCPDATYLASYKRWKELSDLAGNGPYHTILKSEYQKKKGIALLIPFSLYSIDSGPKERFLSYHQIHVYDVSQVNDVPYPAPFTPYVFIKDLAFHDFLCILRVEEKSSLRFVPIKETSSVPRQKDAYVLNDTIFYNPQAEHVKEAVLYAYINYVTHMLCLDKHYTVSDENFICRAATRSLFRYYGLDALYQAHDVTRLILDLEKIIEKENDELFLILHYILLVIKTCIYRIKSGFKVQLSTNSDNGICSTLWEVR